MNTITLGTPSLATDLSLPPQARKILSHLEKGKSITPMEAMIVYHISRLSDCIFKIRNAGYNVECETRKDEVGAKYARYTLVR
jgi:hypothetical protein